MAKMTKAQLEQYERLLWDMHAMIRARFQDTYQQEAYLEALQLIDEEINGGEDDVNP